MINRKTLTVFLVGFVLGFLLALVAREFLSNRLPGAVSGGRESLEGVVTAKQLEEGRLLLTVVTEAGATLVTFKKRVAEIALLVDEGDRVTLTLRRYQPFLEDPNITRVAKPDTFGIPSRPPATDSTETPPDTTAEQDSTPPVSDAPWYD
ncbi:MAG: hypothetical protein JSV86_03240 [Gemmatimonadota bacterium]|nr:MAG: hypothetical protein JSV86_03240 [Gemmatimonadota bacterium]